jgi:hypothetical protein
MKYFIMILTISVFLFAGQTVIAQKGWIDLFNGKDLYGWKPNYDHDAFAVVDGVMRVHATKEAFRSHLFYVGEDDELVKFKNFELKVVSRGKPNSNSGIFFHTDFSERDVKRHLGKGYEVQLNSAKMEKRKTGSLYAIVDLDKAPVDDTKWFELHIIVNGKRIVVNVDGKKVIDYTEPENPERPPNRKNRLLDPKGGALALQAHDTNSTWYFKEVKVKRLPD